MNKRNGAVILQNVLLSLLVLLVALTVLGPFSDFGGSEEAGFEAIEPGGLLADVVGEDALWKLRITQAGMKWEIENLSNFLAADGMQKEGVLAARALGRLQADQARLESSLKRLRNEVERFEILAVEIAVLKAVVVDLRDRDEGD